VAKSRDYFGLKGVGVSYPGRLQFHPDLQGRKATKLIISLQVDFERLSFFLESFNCSIVRFLEVALIDKIVLVKNFVEHQGEANLAQVSPL
jgi:hypothetical protein